MATKKTKSYSEQYRRDAVFLADQPEKTAREVADDLGIHVNQIYNWRTQFKKLSANQFKTLNGVDYSTDESDEVKRLKHEIIKLKEENEILKKATAYFANLKK